MQRYKLRHRKAVSFSYIVWFVCLRAVMFVFMLMFHLLYLLTAASSVK